MLKEQGYVTHRIKVRQIGTGLDTEVKVLAPPGTTWGEVKETRVKLNRSQSFLMMVVVSIIRFLILYL